MDWVVGHVMMEVRSVHHDVKMEQASGSSVVVYGVVVVDAGGPSENV